MLEKRTVNIVYLITNKTTGRVYVGATQKKLSYRFSEHMNCLERSTHFIGQMQIDFNEYGRDSFFINVLDTAEDGDELSKKEAYWINKYFGENCYNKNNSCIRHGLWVRKIK